MHINNHNYSRCHNNIIQPPWLCGGPKNLASLSQHLILGLLHIQPEQGFGTGEGGSNVWLLSFGGPNEDFKVQECQKSWPHLSIEGGRKISQQTSLPQTRDYTGGKTDCHFSEIHYTSDRRDFVG